MKTRICFMVSLIALLSAPQFPARAATALLHCEAEMRVRKNVTENTPISLHANAHYFFEPAGKGYVDIVGTIQTREKAAHLDRMIYFTYARSARDGFYTVKFTHAGPSRWIIRRRRCWLIFMKSAGKRPATRWTSPN